MIAVLERARLLKMDEVCDFIGLGETTVKKMVKTGQLPAPIKLSPKCVRWRAGDLTDWAGALAPASAERAA